MATKNLLKEMYETINIGLCWKNEKGVYLGCNEYFAKMANLPRSDAIIGKKDIDLPWKEQADIINSTDQLIFKNKTFLQMYERLFTDSFRLYLVNKKPVVDNDGTINIVSSYVEVIDLKLTTKNIEYVGEDSISADDILYNLPGLIYWKNTKFQYMGFNKNVVLLSGLSSQELLGKTDKELKWGATEAESFQHDDQEVMKSGEAKITEHKIPIMRSDGNYMIVRTEKTQLRDKTGHVAGILGVAIDVTEEKRAEEREKNALLEKALLEAAEAKTKAQLEENLRLAVTVVAGRIAHDIRTPLSILMRKSENLEDLIPIVLDGYKKAEENNLEMETISTREYNYLQEIPETFEAEMIKLNEFISSTLKMLSKLVSGEINRDDLEICWINIIIGRALKDYPYADDHQKSLIECKLDKGFAFLGNDVLLTYAFYNLIKNSLYQIEKNGKGKIYISSESAEQNNLVRFKDTAGGASPEIVKQFFSGYKTNKQEGTGLGLVSIKQTMQLFGGDITCHSVEGEFIEFIFSFPKIEKTIVKT